MKTNLLKNITPLILVLLFHTKGFTLASEEAPSVLEYMNHPDSPQHNHIYKDDLISLTTTLSWIDRFNGDETFNESEVLQQSSSITSSTELSQTSGNHSMEMDGMGVIKSIRAEQGKVKISHGPIEKYGMPEMTMMFKVKDPSILETVKEGQKIGFNVDNSSGGFVVTHIMPEMAMKEGISMSSDESGSDEMDARGVVKTIRLSQRKIKIQHGPIEKYDMPGMTMVFNFHDSAILEGVESGSEINFNIDNSSGGFEITDIKIINK